MAWEVWWALVLGFAISAIVQAWVPRERIQAALAGEGSRPIARATGLGAASSSCSYAAIAIAKSLFQKGASRGVRARLPVRLDEPRVGARARAVGAARLAVHARRVPRRHRDDRADGGCCCGCSSSRARGATRRSTRRPADAGHSTTPRPRLRWRERSHSLVPVDVAHNFRGDWQMLYKEIAIGFLLAGFIALLGDDFFNGLFLTDAPAGVQVVWGVRKQPQPSSRRSSAPWHAGRPAKLLQAPWPTPVRVRRRSNDPAHAGDFGRLAESRDRCATRHQGSAPPPRRGKA